MKRINPNTGKPFKRGDTREDGMVFNAYQLNAKLPSDPQYFYENWRTQEDFERIKAAGNNQVRKFLNGKRAAAKTAGVKGKKRLNPSTGKKYVLGDPNEDQSRYFQAYDNWYVEADGYSRIIWMTKAAMEKFRVNAKRSQLKSRESNRIGYALYKAKRRAKEKKVPFDLSAEYLEEIFPKDNLCPVFGLSFEWGGGSDEASRDNSPSLDRIVPELGYVEGNVVWISNRANILKRDATWEELQRVAEWLRSVTPE